MGRKVCSVLTVCFVFMASLHLEAVVRKSLIYYPSRALAWEEARLHCRKMNVDLVTMQTLNEEIAQRALQYTPYSLSLLWTGLVRHPEDAKVWKEVSFKSGGLSEDNVSQSIRWENRHMEPLCAFVSQNDQMWHSDLCSKKKYFYCSFMDRIKYFRIAKSWYNASHYCHIFSGQLVNMHLTNAYSLNKTGWIGGYKRDDIWNWVGNFTPSVTKWAPNEPQFQDCAAYNLSSKMYVTTLCSERLPPFCLNDNLLVVKENKTWEEAVDYCLTLNGCERNLSCRFTYNLLSLDEGSDYNYIRDRIYRATTEVWIGLRFLGGSWWWLDGHRVDQKWKLPSCPSEGNHCGTMSNYGTRKWIIRDCSEKRNFICDRKLNIK